MRFLLRILGLLSLTIGLKCLLLAQAGAAHNDKNVIDMVDLLRLFFYSGAGAGFLTGLGLMYLAQIEPAGQSTEVAEPPVNDSTPRPRQTSSHPISRRGLASALVKATPQVLLVNVISLPIVFGIAKMAEATRPIGEPGPTTASLLLMTLAASVALVLFSTLLRMTRDRAKESDEPLF